MRSENGYGAIVSPPDLAGGVADQQARDRLGRAAREATAGARERGHDLDSTSGAGDAFRIIADQVLALPLPGSGQTTARLAALAAVAAVDVTLGRLVEAHADAVAILAELDGPPAQPGQRWAVWAAEGPAATVRAATGPGTATTLSGAKPWCSGATLCTHALVTAAGADGRALYAVELEPQTAHPSSGGWAATGLSGSATETVTFAAAKAVTVGKPGAYLRRPGFWHGAVGVAAVWWGAARGIAAMLYAAAADRDVGPHALAHLGAIEAALAGSAALLRQAGATIDAAPHLGDERLALTVRASVEAAAATVVERTGRALGPGPLSHDRDHARRIADLTVYLRQSHAEGDLARIGELAAADSGGTP